MKKKILILLMAFAVAMTFMPTMAFANPESDPLPNGVSVYSGDYPATANEDYIYIADTKVLHLLDDLRLEGTFYGTLILGQYSDTLIFDNFNIISDADNCIDASAMTSEVLYITLSGSNSLTLNEKQLNSFTGKQGAQLPLYLPTKTLTLAGTGSISITNNIPNYPATVCKELLLNGTPVSIEFKANHEDGALLMEEGNEVKLPENGNYYLYGSNTVDGTELSEAYYSEGKYYVNGSVAKTLLINNGPLHPDKPNNLLKKIIKGVAIAAGVAAVAGVVGTTAINVQKGVAAQQKAYQAKLQQQMVQKQAAQIKTLLRGAKLVVSLVQFGSSLRNLHGFNQFGFTQFRLN